MVDTAELRQYAVLRATPELRAAYIEDKVDRLRELTIELMRASSAPPTLWQDPGSFHVVGAPSLDWQLAVVGEHPPPPRPDALVIAYACAGPSLVSALRAVLLAPDIKTLLGGLIRTAGADPGGARADHWCPGAGDAVFGHRAHARRLLGAEALAAAGLRGQKVNVAIIDEGLDRAALDPRNWGGGLSWLGRAPGSAPRSAHGMLIARNVLDLAPDAVLYDVPLVPPRITQDLVFAADAHAAYVALLQAIGFLRQFPRWSGPWVLVNAWAIFDRASEHPLGDYSENRHPDGHPLNQVIGTAAREHGIDVVFAAGNCGQFGPDGRCGVLDRGPGRSIWGANAHEDVITVGAVRADGRWIGGSSQGPGPEALASRKPDVCAPSWFSETTDAAVRNRGTSTSCGLTAGVVAALRSQTDGCAHAVTPSTLKQALIDSARKTEGADWSGRLGHGVLDAAAALAALRRYARA
jgi:hypothetical protein